MITPVLPGGFRESGGMRAEGLSRVVIARACQSSNRVALAQGTVGFGNRLEEQHGGGGVGDQVVLIEIPAVAKVGEFAENALHELAGKRQRRSAALRGPRAE